MLPIMFIEIGLNPCKPILYADTPLILIKRCVAPFVGKNPTISVF